MPRTFKLLLPLFKFLRTCLFLAIPVVMLGSCGDKGENASPGIVRYDVTCTKKPIVFDPLSDIHRDVVVCASYPVIWSHERNGSHLEDFTVDFSVDGNPFSPSQSSIPSVGGVATSNKAILQGGAPIASYNYTITLNSGSKQQNVHIIVLGN